MKQKSLTGFMNEVIEELCQQERFATAHIYTYALRAFTEFVGGGEIFFGGLNKSSLRHFQRHLETWIIVFLSFYRNAVQMIKAYDYRFHSSGIVLAPANLLAL